MEIYQWRKLFHLPKKLFFQKQKVTLDLMRWFTRFLKNKHFSWFDSKSLKLMVQLFKRLVKNVQKKTFENKTFTWLNEALLIVYVTKHVKPYMYIRASFRLILFSFSKKKQAKYSENETKKNNFCVFLHVWMLKNAKFKNALKST